MRKTLHLSFLAVGLFLGSQANATTHTIQVGVSGNNFSPASISSVVLGDTIKFVLSSGSHTATSSSIPTGATSFNYTTFPAVYVPAVAGTYSYVCSFHPGMAGSFDVSCGPGPTTPTIAATGSTTTCAPNTVALSTPVQGGATYQWFNGATAISGATTNSFNATTSGSYTVKVTRCATNSTSAATTVTINPKPAPNFTMPASTSPTQTFVNTTPPADTTGVTWLWNFGDGQTSTLKNPPAHTYTTAGVKTVKLIATRTATSCKDSVSKTTGNITLGVSTIGIGESFTIMPNPASNNITVRTAGVVPSLSLVDFSGRTISAPITINGKDQNINIQSVPSGIYLLRLTTSNGSAVEKITIIH